MMALKLQDLRDKHGHVNRSASTSLQKRLVNSWPAVSGGKKGKAAAASNKAGIQSASSVQVGDMSVNVADGEDARLQLRHEVDRVLASRGTGSGMQYLVKWKHCAAQDATWEASSSGAMRSDAARAALAACRSGKSLPRRLTGRCERPTLTPGDAFSSRNPRSSSRRAQQARRRTSGPPTWA